MLLTGAALGLLLAVLRVSRRRAAPQPLSRRPGPSRPVTTRPPARPARAIRVDVPTALYHYEWADRPPAPIYYGISNDPPARHRRHEVDPDDRWWMSRSTGVMVLDTQYPNRPAALAAERTAIRAAHARGHELANYQHNPGRRRRVAARQARRYT